MKTLLIDDLRDLEADLIARDYEQGARLLKEHWGEIDTLLLDHDLGHESAPTGYDIVKQFYQFLPEKVVIVSANPIGVENIGCFLKQVGYESDVRRRVWVKTNQGDLNESKSNN